MMADTTTSKIVEIRRKIQTWNVQYNLYDRLIRLAQAAVALCYLNQAGTSFQIWWQYNQPFPWWFIPMLPASLLVMLNLFPIPACCVLLAYATVESAIVTSRQLLLFYVHGYLYINELMTKKFALLGAIGLILSQHYNPKGDKPIMAGLLLSDSDAPMNKRKSILMLVGRILLSSMFLYVGITEIQRQAESGADHHGHAHKRPEGDGHDHMWYKLLEFALGLPFLVGFKTNTAAWLLALTLIVEALTAWAWWRSQFHIGYILHAREHFMVDIAVAGGLMMLTHVGVGKYTVDEMLRKKDA